MTHDPDIRLPTAEWNRANAAADRLPKEQQGQFFTALADELRARLQAAGRFDDIEVEIIAEDCVTVALAKVMGRVQ